MKKIVHCLITGYLIIFFSGCISVPGKKLPKYTHDQLDKGQKKHAIDYFAFILPGRKDSVRIFNDEIQKVLTESNLFSKVTSGTKEEKYHFTFALSEEITKGAFIATLTLSILTATLLPGWGRNKYTLYVEVEKNGQLIKRYKYKHHLDTWVQMFVVFGMGKYKPSKGQQTAIDQMVMAFLHDLQQDRILD